MSENPTEPKQERPLGQLFTKVYRDRGEAHHDDPRFRVQVHQAFCELLGKQDFEAAQYLRGTAGIELPPQISSYFQWETYFKKCSVEDLLDLITHIARFAEGLRPSSKRSNWVERVQQAIETHNMAFEIDVRGGMHHKVDAAFQRSAEMTLSCLADGKFEAARSEVEAALDFLTQTRPDPKMAVVNVFMAAENVFKLVAGTETALTKSSITQDLRRLCQKRSADIDPVANRSINSLISSVGDWVDACHPYRHGQKDTGIVAPPIDLAIALVTTGIDHIRWMVSLA